MGCSLRGHAGFTLANVSTYSRANTTVQWFADNFSGDAINPNVLVLHTTETGSWPTYLGGATAPHVTALANPTTNKVMFRQHFPFEVSARALRNLPGGVETNTLNCVQIELIGTCAPATHIKFPGWTYWPEAPEWALRQVAAFVAELHDKFPAFEVVDGAPRGWLPYPASFGNNQGQRMTPAEWHRSRGIVGHQHVPENDHGDPGHFPIDALVGFAQPAPVHLTLIQRVRRTLVAARERAIIAGKTGRARRIQAALDALPKD